MKALHLCLPPINQVGDTKTLFLATRCMGAGWTLPRLILFLLWYQSILTSHFVLVRLFWDWKETAVLECVWGCFGTFLPCFFFFFWLIDRLKVQRVSAAGVNIYLTNYQTPKRQCSKVKRRDLRVRLPILVLVTKRWIQNERLERLFPKLHEQGKNACKPINTVHMNCFFRLCP